MNDVKINNLELFYDCMDESNNYLHGVFHKPYFELIEMTVENILAGEVVTELEDESQIKALNKIYKKIKNVDFTVEDVRKAMQSIILRGFKEMGIPNGNTTPDTMGMLFTYLITKIHKDKDISIYDPLCGTGNLLLTISNYLDRDCQLYACDNDLWMTKLTAMTANLLNTPVEIYHQNTMSLALADMDCIVFDAPKSEVKDNKYFPYEAILHFSRQLRSNGAIIGIVENDFFDHDSDSEFKKELLKTMSILGIIELPDNMFKTGKPKIILVLQKKHLENAQCFMVKMPSVTDVELFNKSLLDIEAWFKKNNY